ncbi:metallophosphoesterase family protein [Thermoflexus sp.]|uniref:metallophosphoesterase family protein n=1 Tax=Thermoflexus sp. TaxID=1969742 RepID=UPI00176E0584|nr:metallophosphoesterase family protein [Thermoflexus sp.]
MRTMTVGLIADTHVPQRLERLPPPVIEVFRGVALILHAGDLNRWPVLDELARLAPVVAVRGNADLGLRLPWREVVEINGVRIGLVHGHGGWPVYLKNKIRETALGFEPLRYLRYARFAFRDPVHVIVSGHTHRPHLVRVNGVWLVNPGPVAPDYYVQQGPAVGLLHVSPADLRYERIDLSTGRARDWVLSLDFPGEGQERQEGWEGQPSFLSHNPYLYS